MSNFFSTIYETWFQLYNPNFRLIFDTLYDYNGYVMFGLLFTIIPLFTWLTFYYLWKYPYGKFWHWLSWLMITLVIVGGSTFSLANNAIFASDNPSLNGELSVQTSGYEQFAMTLPLTYALINILLTIILSIFYSLIFKQFSKIQIHLPF
jgi:hypothetical protein